MKLGEALTRRADTQRRIEELRKRLLASALIQEGSEPPENANELLAEFRELADELQRLVFAINYTNLNTVAGAATLTDALARRDSLTLRHSVLRGVADAASDRGSRFMRSELRMQPTVDVTALRDQAEQLARERRELDVRIQETNWATELIQ